MVVGGEVVTLKSIEESSNLLIAEMPINVSFSLMFYHDDIGILKLFFLMNKKLFNHTADLRDTLKKLIFLTSHKTSRNT